MGVGYCSHSGIFTRKNNLLIAQLQMQWLNKGLLTADVYSRVYRCREYKCLAKEYSFRLLGEDSNNKQKPCALWFLAKVNNSDCVSQ